MTVDILILVASLAVIWIFSDQLIVSIHSISQRFKIPQSIAGATLAAIGSSFPEFLTSAFSVVLSSTQGAEGGAGYADVGIGTIIGSAIFNVCIIIGVSSFFRRLDVERRVFSRDCLWYLLTTISAIVFIYDGRIDMVESLFWLGMYAAYALTLSRDIKRYPESRPPEEAETVSTAKACGLFIVSVGIMGIACHFLVESTASLGAELDSPTVLLSLLAVAAGTSIPDILASVHAARKGLTSLAISNAIGSNIFDILICLGLPMAIHGGVQGSAFEIGRVPPGMEDLAGVARTLLAFGLVCLLISVVLATITIRTGWVVTRVEGSALLVLFALFAVGSIVIFLERLVLPISAIGGS